MSTNKFSKYVIDNIVVGTPISSIVAAGATIGLDSAAVTALIDSDYVQQRETSGLDSAEVIALIDSDYVSARTPTANGGGLDSAAALDLFAYGIEEVGVNQRQAAISLNTFVDPFNQTGNNDRAFNLNYTSTTGMFIRETGGRTEIHADASGTGQSTGLLLLGASFGNNGTEIVGNVKLSSLPTTDPAETGLLWNDGGIPVFSGSTAPTGGTGLDSAAVEGIVDSAYVQARQTPQDFAYSSLTGAPTALSSFTNDTNYITAADIPTTVDSDYVQARVTLDGVGLDSAGVTALVDSDYVAARAPAAAGGLDSAAVISTINDEFKVSSSRVEIGQLANASGGFSVALGYGSTASGTASFAIGDATASSSNALAIVDNAVASASLAIAIGQRAEATHINTIALGNEADAKSNYGIAIGDNAAATNANTLAIGKGANASGLNAVAIGGDNNTSAVGNTSVALGHNAKTGGSSQVAIGDGAGSTTDTSSHAVMIGPNAGALCGQFSSALGYFAQASGGNAVAIGARTRADGLNSIQISATGVQRIISTQYEIDIRTSAAGSLTYDTTNDWTFGAGVTMTDLTASGATVVFSNLPTTDPVNAGQLWNDGGTLKVSAG